MVRIAAGTLMIVTGGIHNAFGLLLGFGLIEQPGGARRNLVGEMIYEGVVGTAEADPLRMTFFWFEYCGALFVVLGALMLFIERRGQPLPASLGWMMLTLAVVGVVFVPASGLWLLIPQAALIVRRARSSVVASNDPP